MRMVTFLAVLCVGAAHLTAVSPALAQSASQPQRPQVQSQGTAQSYWRNVIQQMTSPHASPTTRPNGPATVTSVCG